MKKYKRPKVSIVALDTDQAILNVCMVGGVYLSQATICVGGATTVPTNPCLTSNRGNGGESTWVASGEGATPNS
jgi:hypothetical protein